MRACVGHRRLLCRQPLLAAGGAAASFAPIRMADDDRRSASRTISSAAMLAAVVAAMAFLFSSRHITGDFLFIPRCLRQAGTSRNVPRKHFMRRRLSMGKALEHARRPADI